jgi:hypothetical protein
VQAFAKSQATNKYFTEDIPRRIKHGTWFITHCLCSKQGKKRNQRPTRGDLSNLRASPIVSKKSLGKSMSFASD